jgi:LysR family transcriptional activator of nhaA
MPIDLNYHHLYYFWVCARAGRVTAAAQELHLSQSALSLQLKSLERSVGRSLLNRTRAGLELTAGGRVVFDHCERIFAHGAALSAALRAGSETRPTEIRLGVSSAIGRDAALTFIDRLSSIEGSTVSVYVGQRDDLRERLARRRLDVAMLGADLTPQLGAGFRAARVGTLPLYFVASPAMAKSLGGFPRAGQDVPMLFRTQEYAPRRDVERWLLERGVKPVTVAESEDADLLQELARRGRGVVALHKASAARGIASGALVRVGPAVTGLQHEVWVITPSAEPVDPVLRRALAEAVRP